MKDESERVSEIVKSVMNVFEIHNARTSEVFVVLKLIEINLEERYKKHLIELDNNIFPPTKKKE
ncbi:hypothetical protein LCGC14_0546050 [marine sediment metagenome]|uniref:Uncharacterized protein n=1 Tax=marine sediment metagenome TaxID=412755 RepID=A0A0F9RRE1_9ZZZZ